VLDGDLARGQPARAGTDVVPLEEDDIQPGASREQRGQ
jgi:hypothetical protein